MSAQRGNRRATALAATICLGALLAAAGCGGGGSSGGSAGGGGNRPNQPDSAGRLVGKVQTLDPGSLTAAQVAADDTAFGFSLFHALCSADPTSNLTLSPASAAQALGMLDAGSAGATQRKIGALLHLPAWSPQLVAALNEQTVALAKVAQVKVSNHVFEQTGLAPTQQTLDDLVTAYNADLRLLDFSDEPGATDSINHVISDDTDGLIPKLFGEPLDASTQTVLANAILLDAKWQQPFPTSSPGPFHTSPTDSVTTSMMDNSHGSFASRTAGGWQSVVLPYQGGTLQAVAILPPDSAAATSACATPTPAIMKALTTGTSTGAGVVLPKLDLSQTLPLTQTLSDLGLPLQGDYSGLGHGDNTISEVIQKVVMKVDETGTKAAAATGIGITDSAVVGGHTTVTFDRPFLLVLDDTATQTPLFVAHVADPTGS